MGISIKKNFNLPALPVRPSTISNHNSFHRLGTNIYSGVTHLGAVVSYFNVTKTDETTNAFVDIHQVFDSQH